MAFKLGAGTHRRRKVATTHQRSRELDEIYVETRRLSKERRVTRILSDLGVDPNVHDFA
jgi:type II secretory pathway predicted ATPase ExeA